MARIISPSLLSANFSRLSDDINRVENLGVNRLHLDVMDGHFVPNLTFGPFIIEQIRKSTNCHLETHLMIENPGKYIKDYADAGSDTIFIHYEASADPVKDLQYIRTLGKKSGIAIYPMKTYNDTFMFQSHIAGDWNDNVWNDDNYENFKSIIQSYH